jgi:hypothetical protein
MSIDRSSAAVKELARLTDEEILVQGHPSVAGARPLG